MKPKQWIAIAITNENCSAVQRACRTSKRPQILIASYQNKSPEIKIAEVLVTYFKLFNRFVSASLKKLSRVR